MFRSVISSLIALTGLSCLQLAFSPRLPAADEPEVDLRRIPHVRAALIEVFPKQRNRDWSLSPMQRYSLHSLEGQLHSPVVDLLLAGVAVRRQGHLQLSLVTQGNPNLEMDQRTLHHTVDGHEYAIGTIGGRDALQTCQVPSGGSGVTQETLAPLSWPEPFYRRSPAVLLRRLAGLQPNQNYGCVLITLISPVKDQRDQLMASWRMLRQAI